SWQYVRESTGMETSSKSMDAATWATDLINGRNISNDDPIMREFLVMLSGYLTKKIERKLLVKQFVKLYPALTDCVPNLYEAYDKRIHAFDEIIDAVKRESRGSSLDSICAAFFANLILPGSMAHIG